MLHRLSKFRAKSRRDDGATEQIVIFFKTPKSKIMTPDSVRNYNIICAQTQVCGIARASIIFIQILEIITCFKHEIMASSQNLVLGLIQYSVFRKMHGASRVNIKCGYVNMASQIMVLRRVH